MKKKIKSIFNIILVVVLSFTFIIPVYGTDNSQAETQASALKQLRLFKGVSSSNFDLGREPTRTEAMIMLIRVLGQEQEALNGNWSHPFTDVVSWADKYIGYAYEKGLTKGISETEFGTGNADSDMYLTFMLRALNYSDSAGDFTWDAPDTFAESVGVLPSGVDTENFMRKDAVLVSWASLEARLKVGSQTLAQKLMDMRIFTSSEYESANLFVENDGGIVVSSFAELRDAVGNKDINAIQIGSDIDISGELFADRENGPDSIIYIKEGATLTVNGEFVSLGYFITNDGAMIIKDTFDRGLKSLANNGTITVKSGGTFASGMTDTYNYGNIVVEKEGNLFIERGTQFNNYGSIENNGYLYVDNGGSLHNDTGKIANNGIMDLISYYYGNLQDITGNGTINDKRQQN